MSRAPPHRGRPGPTPASTGTARRELRGRAGSARETLQLARNEAARNFKTLTRSVTRSAALSGGRTGARPAPATTAPPAATFRGPSSGGRCRCPARPPGLERLPVFTGGLHRELEDGERLLE